ncbi:MAG: histidinol-phosphatase HisJ family protein [Lachnospiraceae bacterium]
MIICDFHNHTDFSGDSNTPPESMIEKAMELGLTCICMTDHMDLDFPYKDPDFTFSVPDYFKKHRELRKRCGSRLTLLTGIELGLQPQISQELRALVSAWPFDFVIGSSHIVDHMDPYYPEYWEQFGEEQGILRYFETIPENIAAFDDIDVYGHIDYIVRYAPSKAAGYSYRKYAEILDEILKILISRNIGLEVNTAGYKYGLGFPNPHTDILKRYRELGGEIITVGSDGHCPEHLAYDFQKVPALLKECGFSYYTMFRQRKPEFIKL